MTEIRDGDFAYDWHEQWADLPDTSDAPNGTTHGVQVLGNGDIVVFNQADPALLTYSPDGKLKASSSDMTGAHGLARVVDDGREVLWAADCEKVCKLSTDGEVLMTLNAPPAGEIPDAADVDHEQRSRYIPTWADRAPSGDIWVADGYGSYQLFRYGADGSYKGKIDGTEGAGRFNEPHSARFSPTGELWVTDRSSRRVCVYDADGKYLRHSDTACHSPADFAFGADGKVYVAEIAGAVKVLDNDLNVLANLGENQRMTMPQRDWEPGWVPRDQIPGWPDPADDELVEGQFNTPHGIAVDAAGNVFVAEWRKGGRVVKLARK